MLILTEKRINTLEALRSAFGKTVTRENIASLVSDGTLPAWPYWITDDLTLKTAKNQWSLPPKGSYRLAKDGDTISPVQSKRFMISAGLVPPSFNKTAARAAAPEPPAPVIVEVVQTSAPKRKRIRDHKAEYARKVARRAVAAEMHAN